MVSAGPGCSGNRAVRMSLILKTAHPQMPLDPNRFRLDFPLDLSLIDVLCAKSASVLSAMPVVTYDLPPSVASQVSVLPTQLAQISAMWQGMSTVGNALDGKKGEG